MKYHTEAVLDYATPVETIPDPRIYPMGTIPAVVVAATFGVGFLLGNHLHSGESDIVHDPAGQHVGQTAVTHATYR